MSNFFRDSVRGGMSFISKRHSKSCYSEMLKETQLNNHNQKHIRYIDCNHLYGSKMLFDMPVGNFKFEKIKTISKIERLFKKSGTIKMRKNRGMFLEVDLIYPDNIHKYHSNFPLAPEKFNVKFEHLSPLCKKCINFQTWINSKRNFFFLKINLLLIFNKKNYILHYNNLTYYLKMGMKLKKIHIIVSFNQKPFFKNILKS